MYRSFNTDRNGRGFSEATKIAVWQKGKVIPGQNPALVRKDACGAVITWDQYGITIHHGTGWEIDHMIPVAANGSDDLWNLQPLQWQNNRSKGDGLMNCAVSAGN